MQLSRIRSAISLPDVMSAKSTPAWITLILRLIWPAVAIPGFLQPARLLALGQKGTPLLVSAHGHTVVALIGGLDISFGASLSQGLVLASVIMQGRAESALPGAIICLLVGSFVGLKNGVLIEGPRLPPLIATIG